MSDKQTFFVNNDQSLLLCLQYIEGIDPADKWLVTIKRHRSRRSLAQNRLLHMWMQVISEEYYLTHGEYHAPAVWKEYFKQLFLGDDVSIVLGSHVVLPRKTSALNTAQMAEFLNKIDMYCAAEFEIQLPQPEDMYLDAMGVL
ncbi:MAG: hypothetical protein D6698_05285 [Gammaproteobacteria bacterium]|nr:MAG: hypothetical protein D6698_05285 [Gammaproteobacteria bacterium]